MQRKVNAHSHMSVFMISHLLDMNRHFLPTEAKTDDIKCKNTTAHVVSFLNPILDIINMISLSNGLKNSGLIVSLLPNYALRHYILLSRKYPEYFPESNVSCRRLVLINPRHLHNPRSFHLMQLDTTTNYIITCTIMELLVHPNQRM
jgi:hypothetical protein